MLDLIQSFLDLGSIVVLPILIFVFAVALGTPVSKAIKSGLTVGIGFIGLNLVIGLLGSSLGPAAQQMVEHLGLNLNIIDVGWPAAAAISYGTALGGLSIPIAIGINIVLIFFGLTRTMNVDLWNIWHAAFISSLVYIITGDFAISIAATVSYVLMILLFGDILGGTINRYYKFPNITFPHGTAIPGYIFALPFNWLFDRIPVVKDWKGDPETIQEKLGIFGDSTVMGVLIGLGIGLLAQYEIKELLQLGVTTGAVMMLMPRMVALLMEGLTPISQAANAFIKKKFPDRELYIGMDAALSVGDPAVLSSSLILVPITIALAVVLPFNNTLPFGDLATIPFVVCLMAAVFNGNIIRTIIAGTFYMATILCITTWVAPLVTEAAVASNFDLQGNTTITALAEGGLWTTGLYVLVTKLLNWTGIIAIGGVCLAGLFYVNKIKGKSEKTPSVKESKA
ncbi:PTS galactitol transporter subunit IIC [Vibrio sp. 10N.286.49.C2]|uniref:PTS galactitol transporter subunit IIC n=1 Tax=unclassified Vibrio TaxID=2614977 RepID=UPI000C817505|nr:MULTISPECIES: PTS transporter subunit IIC [unclassified Vibrio]PMH37701.1 PTS galactitol transporter subunit IIC [Vibrio sp. 10N.286.49.C2]PMH45134.1 PTS galactitol transporter subunit IIC [Vibrio sp. 10N.286.49.B1]PMH79091.1 PTS galactitol transporter subunit IIC [Vibrio sp. 10N.286.48.B7]